MIDYNELIAEKIANAINLDKNEIKQYIEIPPQSDMGDFAFPCFKLAKTLRKSPVQIADDIKEKISEDEYIKKIETKSGYLNFYINNTKLVEEVLEEINTH